jgi:hypothetical protein
MQALKQLVKDKAKAATPPLNPHDLARDIANAYPGARYDLEHAFAFGKSSPETTAPMESEGDETAAPRSMPEETKGNRP